MTKLQKALARGLKQDGDLSEALGKLDNYTIESKEDAQAIVEALRTFPRAEGEENNLHTLASLFQDVSGPDADSFDVLNEHGIPELIRLFDQIKDQREQEDTALFLLKILAMYGNEQGTAKVIEAANEGYHDDNYLWSIILSRFSAGHPGTPMVLEAFESSLPDNFLAVALLDMANQIAVNGEEPIHHPFDSPEGKERLEQYLRNSDPEQFSYAHSATAALPFISNPERDQLLALAMDHPDPTVQMEGAWASARLGSPAGVKMLARYCLDPHHSQTACNYLRELGQAEQIPAEARDPDFQAMAEMCSWLAHPQEFGRPPDHIELADGRELFWPPTDDHRYLWLFKYRYDPAPDDPEGEVTEGYGLVGSTTFALFGETTADMSPEDVYALHCCWELELNEDPRAPQERSVEAGRKLLAAENEGF